MLADGAEQLAAVSLSVGWQSCGELGTDNRGSDSAPPIIDINQEMHMSCICTVPDPEIDISNLKIPRTKIMICMYYKIMLFILALLRFNKETRIVPVLSLFRLVCYLRQTLEKD